MNNPKKKALLLLFIYSVIYLAIYLLLFYTSFEQTKITGTFTHPSDLPGADIIVTTITVLVFIPLTLRMKHYAKCAGMQMLNKFASILLFVSIFVPAAKVTKWLISLF